VDVDRLRAWCCEEIELVLQGRPRALGDDVAIQRGTVGALAAGEMAGFLTAREQVVTSLTAEVARACGDVPVQFMDVSGGLRGSGSGMSTEVTDDPAPARSWQEGTDLDGIASACHGVQMLGYSAESDAIASDLEAYLAHVAPERLAVALRPMHPDVASSEDVASKVQLLRAAGVGRVDFYHYAFIPLDHLPWIAAALRDDSVAGA
jgi:hypothetical protein